MTDTFWTKAFKKVYFYILIRYSNLVSDFTCQAAKNTGFTTTNDFTSNCSSSINNRFLTFSETNPTSWIVLQHAHWTLLTASNESEDRRLLAVRNFGTQFIAVAYLLSSNTNIYTSAANVRYMLHVICWLSFNLKDEKNLWIYCTLLIKGGY
jgi:hypothetical protein